MVSGKRRGTQKGLRPVFPSCKPWLSKETFFSLLPARSRGAEGDEEITWKTLWQGRLRTQASAHRARAKQEGVCE